MFPLDSPPNTSAYMIAGYVVFFIIAAIYLISLWVRWRNLHQDLNTLETIQKENEQKAKKSKKSEGSKISKRK